MIFFNIGDGYSSGCCTGSTYFFSYQDPTQQAGGGYWEHPSNTPGSFVSQLANLYQASCITIARHRTTVDELIDSTDSIVSLISNYKQNSKIAFYGVPDMYSQIVGDEYLLLDGHDETVLSEDEYINSCANKTSQDISTKIVDLQESILKISKVVDKVIVYWTTAQPINLVVSDNVVCTNISVIDYLKDKKPYKRGYYDTSAYKKLSKEFIKLL